MSAACHQALEGICVVQTAIERYQSGPTCLTAIHCDLIQVIYLHRCVYTSVCITHQFPVVLSCKVPEASPTLPGYRLF